MRKISPEPLGCVRTRLHAPGIVNTASLSGVYVVMGTAVIDWICRRQKSTSKSSLESEAKANGEGAMDGIYKRELAKDFGVNASAAPATAPAALMVITPFDEAMEEYFNTCIECDSNDVEDDQSDAHHHHHQAYNAICQDAMKNLIQRKLEMYTPLPARDHINMATWVNVTVLIATTMSIEKEVK